jgi:hypothetical protein
MKLRLNSNCCARQTCECIILHRIQSVQCTEIGVDVSNITEFFFGMQTSEITFQTNTLYPYSRLTNKENKLNFNAAYLDNLLYL